MRCKVTAVALLVDRRIADRQRISRTVSVSWEVQKEDFVSQNLERRRDDRCNELEVGRQTRDVIEFVEVGIRRGSRLVEVLKWI